MIQRYKLLFLLFVSGLIVAEGQGGLRSSNTEKKKNEGGGGVVVKETSGGRHEDWQLPQQTTATPSLSLQPSVTPLPTTAPSVLPSLHPSDQPSDIPSQWPSLIPSTVPSQWPSGHPSTAPSHGPSKGPSLLPSQSMVPTGTPSISTEPTQSLAPSQYPSTVSSSGPSGLPADDIDASSLKQFVPLLDFSVTITDMNGSKNDTENYWMTWLQDYLATGMRDGFRSDLDRILLRRKTTETTRSTNIMLRSATAAMERLDLAGTAIFENENNPVNQTAFYEYQHKLLELLNQKEEGIRFVTQSERETPSGGVVLSANEAKDDGVHVESGALWGGISAGLLVLVSGLFVFCRRCRNSVEEDDASDKLREIPVPVEIKHTSSQRAAAEPSSLSLAEIARLSSPILNLAEEETDSSVEQSPLQPIVPAADNVKPLPEDDQTARSTSYSSPLKKKVSFASTPPRKPGLKPEEEGDKDGEDESSHKCESLSSAAAVCPTKASSPSNKHPKGVLNNGKPNIPPVVRTKTGTRPHIKAVKLFSGNLTGLLENQEEESCDTKEQLSDKGSKIDENSDGSSRESVQLVDNQEEQSCDTEEQPSDKGSDSDEDPDESSRKSVQLVHDVPPGPSSSSVDSRHTDDSVPENAILTCGVRAAKLLSGTVHVVDKTPEHQDEQEVDSATTGQSSKGSTYDGVEIVSVCSRSVSTKHSLTSLSKGEDSDGDTGTEGSRVDSNGLNEDEVYEKDTLANVSLPENAEEEPARAVLGESGVTETPEKNDQDDCSSEEESYSGWETDDNDSMDSADLHAVREGSPHPVDGRTKTTTSSPSVKATELLSGTFLDRTPEKKIVDGDSSFSENGSESTDHPLDNQLASIIHRETEPMPTDSSDRVHSTATELLYGNFETKDTKHGERSSSASVEFSEQDDAASSYSTVSAYKDARQSSQNSVDQGSFHSKNSVTTGSVYSDARQSIRSISENSSSFASAASSLASLHVRAQEMLFGSFQFGRSYNASSTTSSSRGDNDDGSNVYLYSSDDSSSGSSSREEQLEEVNQAATDSLGIDPCSSLDWKSSR